MKRAITALALVGALLLSVVACQVYNPTNNETIYTAMRTEGATSWADYSKEFEEADKNGQYKLLAEYETFRKLHKDQTAWEEAVKKYNDATTDYANATVIYEVAVMTCENYKADAVAIATYEAYEATKVARVAYDNACDAYEKAKAAYEEAKAAYEKEANEKNKEAKDTAETAMKTAETAKNTAETAMKTAKEPIEAMETAEKAIKNPEAVKDVAKNAMEDAEKAMKDARKAVLYTVEDLKTLWDKEYDVLWDWNSKM